MDCKVSVYNGVGKNSGKEYACVVVTLPNGKECRVFDNNLLLNVYQYLNTVKEK